MLVVCLFIQRTSSSRGDHAPIEQQPQPTYSWGETERCGTYHQQGEQYDDCGSQVVLLGTKGKMGFLDS